MGDDRHAAGPRADGLEPAAAGPRAGGLEPTADGAPGGLRAGRLEATADGAPDGGGEWAPDLGSISDAELGSMLRARAARASTEGLPALARAAATTPGARSRIRLGRSIAGRWTLAPVGLAAAVVLALIAGSLGGGLPVPPGSTPSGGAASPEGPNPAGEPPTVRVVSAIELAAALRTDRDRLIGRTFAVSGELGLNPVVDCLAGTTPVECPTVTFRGLGDLGPVIRPVGEVGPGPWDVGGDSIAGVFAIRVTGRDEPGLGVPVLDLLGTLATGPGSLAWRSSVASVFDGDQRLPPDGVDLPNWPPPVFVVDGWLVPASASGYCLTEPAGDEPCVSADWLVPIAPPPGADGRTISSPALRLQAGAYAAFAGRPGEPLAADAIAGTFLVRPLACPPNARCARLAPTPPRLEWRWELLARIDPWPGGQVPSSSPGSDPTPTPEPEASPTPGVTSPPVTELPTLTAPELGKLLDANDLASLAGRLIVFDGTIGPDPVVLCAAGDPELMRCPPYVLFGIGRSSILTWSDGLGPSWSRREARDGRFALRISGDRQGDSTVVFEYLGEFRPETGTAAEPRRPTELELVRDPGTAALVRGWLVAPPPLHCAATTGPRCPTGLLTDGEFQIFVPIGDGGILRSTRGLIVQPGAYERFVPGATPVGVLPPRLGTFLVRYGATYAACPSPAGDDSCLAIQGWEVLARLAH